jgi:hypothetical protein
MLGSWPVAQVETEKLRWAILHHLEASPNYELNDELLLEGARAQGIPTTSDKVRAAVAWLCEQELATCRDVIGTALVVARITDAGSEVAKGYRVFPGVLRPRPGAR